MTTEIDLSICLLREGAAVPRRATEGAAGLDLSACIAGPLRLEPGHYVRVPTGLAIALPAGFEGQVRPRSGLAAKHGVTVLNAPGTIDEDYRGELQVLLVNHGSEPFTVSHGERIAQLVIAPVTRARVRIVDDPAELPETERGHGGFGSTGTA